MWESRHVSYSTQVTPPAPGLSRISPHSRIAQDTSQALPFLVFRRSATSSAASVLGDEVNRRAHGDRRQHSAASRGEGADAGPARRCRGLRQGAIRHCEGGIRAVKPKLLEGIAKALGVPVGALKDCGAETSHDLMALPLRLEEGYGLVPGKDGMAWRSTQRRRISRSSRSQSSPRPKSAPSPSVAKSTRRLTPTGRPLSDVFPGKLMLPCEQPPVLRKLLHYSRTKSTPWKPR